MKTASATLFDTIKTEGIEYSNHESDLYLPDTPRVREILKDFPGKSETRFRNQITGTVWLEIPFAYLPWWEKRLNHKPAAKMSKCYVNRNGQGIRETVDEFTDRKEARRCLAEYRLADPSAEYYLSRRPCKGWND